MRFIDLVGKQFGRLTVIERAPDYISPKGYKQTKWICKCACGNPNDLYVLGCNLGRNHTLSCGCLRDENRHKKKLENRYVFRNGYVIGYLNKGGEYYIDTEDYELVRPYCWCETTGGYLVARNPEDGKLLKLHRLIMCAPDGMIVDHINHDVRDNRRCNLRIVNDQNSVRNRGLYATNKSGIIGVRWVQKEKRWRADIRINRKTIQVGSFENFSDAVAARKAAEEHHFGEYSYANSMAAVPRIGNGYNDDSPGGSRGIAVSNTAFEEKTSNSIIAETSVPIGSMASITKPQSAGGAATI